MADPDLEIRGGGGGHPDSEIRGRPVPPPPKKIFRPFRPHFGLKIRVCPGPPAPPLDPSLQGISVYFSKGPWAFLYDRDSISFLIISRNLAMEYHFIQGKEAILLIASF